MEEIRPPLRMMWTFVAIIVVCVGSVWFALNIFDPDESGEHRRACEQWDNFYAELIERSTAQEELVFRLPFRPTTYGQWSPTQNQIAFWGIGADLGIIDGVTREQLLTLNSPIEHIHWSRDGSQILVVTNQWADVWDVESRERVLRLDHWGVPSSVETTEISRIGHPLELRGAMWNAQETQILTWGGTIARIWDASSGEQALELDTANDDISVTLARWTADETRVIGWSTSGINVWNVATGELLYTIPAVAPRVSLSARWSHDDTRVITWSRDARFFTLWDATSGTQSHVLAADGGLSGVVWSEDERHFLTYANQFSDVGNPAIQLWDSLSGEELVFEQLARLPELHAVTEVMWNADETKLMVVGRNQDESIIAVLDTHLPNDDPLVLPMSRRDITANATWTNDETRIIAWNNAELTVWDAVTGNTIQRLQMPGNVLSVNFNEDMSRALVLTEGAHFMCTNSYIIPSVWDLSA